MTDYDIHSCGYYCDRPLCIKAQRNELRDKFIATIPAPMAEPAECDGECPDKPNNEFNPDWDAMAVMVEEQQRMARRIEELTQREWVDLTNDEIDDIWAEFNDGYGIIEETLWGYERALEAKLKEKNG
jgi:hypothetical protein